MGLENYVAMKNNTLFSYSVVMPIKKIKLVCSSENDASRTIKK